MKTVKIISIIVAICLCFLSFCSCSPNEIALKVNSTPVNKEIYGYYLSVAVNSDKYKNESDKQKIAGRLCAEYVAGTSLLKKYSIELSPEDKVVVSSEVKTNWQLYSAFYQKYSISKQTLCTMLEYESLINALVETLYSKGGEREIPEKEVQKFFNSNYVAAKVAFTPFEATAQESEIKDITAKFTSMAGIIRSGGEFSSAIQQYPDLAEYEDTEHIISSFDSTYRPELFEKLLKSKTGDIQVVRFPRGIYLVQKADASEFFEVYKSKCVVKMKKEQVLNEISALAKDYRLGYNSSTIKKVMSDADV